MLMIFNTYNAGITKESLFKYDEDGKRVEDEITLEDKMLLLQSPLERVHHHWLIKIMHFKHDGVKVLHIATQWLTLSLLDWENAIGVLQLSSVVAEVGNK